MTAKEAKKELDKELKQLLKPHGFYYDRKGYQFIKTTPNGHWGVAPSLTNFSPLFKLAFTFLVRVKEVEEVYQQYSRILPDYQHYSSTIMISYDYFKEERYFEYQLNNSQQVSIAIKDFKYVFESEVLLFLEKHSDLKCLFDLVMTEEVLEIDTTASPDKYIHWLIIAKLSGHGDIKGLAQKYLKDFWANNRVKQDRERIEKLLQDLQTM